MAYAWFRFFCSRAVQEVRELHDLMEILQATAIGAVIGGLLISALSLIMQGASRVLHFAPSIPMDLKADMFAGAVCGAVFCFLGSAIKVPSNTDE